MVAEPYRPGTGCEPMRIAAATADTVYGFALLRATFVS
jgi:hypothetical protein